MHLTNQFHSYQLKLIFVSRKQLVLKFMVTDNATLSIYYKVESDFSKFLSQASLVAVGCRGSLSISANDPAATANLGILVYCRILLSPRVIR